MKPPSSDEFELPSGPNAASSPACADSLASLQRRFDGEIAIESEDVVRHRALCADCRSWEAAAQALEEGLRRTLQQELPVGLAESILEKLRADPVRPHAWRLRVSAAGLALAASVMIAVFGWNLWGPTDQRVTERTGNSRSTPVEVDPISTARLGDSLDEAGTAAAKLARETRRETLNVKLPTLSFPKVSSPLERLEPAVASIQQVQHGAVFSVAPITRSAKRAADLFWKEIGNDMDRKSMNN
jgi:hypothetical protein